MQKCEDVAFQRESCEINDAQLLQSFTAKLMHKRQKDGNKKEVFIMRGHFHCWSLCLFMHS